ncbi:reticulon-4-interacting protein 1 homolog, mitochondrial-like [Amphibalanus amphitrite]|uniref:reticulon-4-interacting protein 1 homolog, mitochondrial-like n=1 Tax=Amphibalanus amphitrite TaxID=1232801 RepID=UPI001C929F14|nr:reticulon-4-interacting protein 1 homolog, mitochondrial-like [Amphibalanus amphitrite]XP_043240955.1 reticulon-4-interacting protein 1 homolog, mitochondrial-like [Amphibalanus amphitrite]XP_043240956.1 reticulon-4-interacting protein 1 homolog, mitochondrial-like [Amphibalanus amphitrite]
MPLLVLGRAGAAASLRRCLVSRRSAHRASVPTEMSAWQIHRYGGPEELQLTTSHRLPTITQPTELLIKVHAASINPIDVAMLGGYGSTTMNLMRQLCGTLEFPLTLGRDVSGEVVAVGGGVSQFRPGDQVWAAVGPQRQGTHAEYVAAAAGSVSLKPRSLSHVEAASIPYVAATAWSALVVTGELVSEGTRRDRRVLVCGAAGGVGSLAVQLLKAWGCQVTATCATDAVELVESLGADVVVDYTAPDADEHLKLMQGYDLILDCSGGHGERHIPLMKPWTYAKYVTLSPPLLKNIDADGLVAGGVRNLAELVQSNISSHTQGRSHRWAFFMPNGCALSQVRDLVDDGKIRPVVQRVVPFELVPDAFVQLQGGHSRGKTVIRVVDEPPAPSEPPETDTGAPSSDRSGA